MHTRKSPKVRRHESERTSHLWHGHMRREARQDGKRGEILCLPRRRNLSINILIFTYHSSQMDRHDICNGREVKKRRRIVNAVMSLDWLAKVLYLSIISKSVKLKIVNFTLINLSLCFDRVRVFAPGDEQIVRILTDTRAGLTSWPGFLFCARHRIISS